MSFLSNFIKKAAPVVAAIAPGTVVGTAAQVVTVAQQRQEAKYQKKISNRCGSRKAKTNGGI